MTSEELRLRDSIRAKYFVYVAKIKSKGVNRTTTICRCELRAGKSYVDYMNELRAYPRLYGYALCAIEWKDYTDENYLYISKTQYRKAIAGIAKKHGLELSEVSEFMNVHFV